MTHNTNKNLTRLHSLLLAFFGDETLHFHSTRLSNFFNTAFAETEFDDDDTPTQTPSIPNLLHTQNDLLRLLDAADLLYQLMPLPIQPGSKPTPTQQLKRIRPLSNNWDDFPSHLHPHEWCNPEIILNEFFSFQSVDEWKNAIYGLLQSAIGEGSPFTSLSEKQAGFIVLMLHRLQDAIWLLHITERIPTPDDNEETCDEPESIATATTKARKPQHPFFIVSNNKFHRIDLQEILCAVSSDDHVQIHTATDIYKPLISIQEIKDILPEEQFTWINQHLAIAITLSNCSPN